MLTESLEQCPHHTRVLRPPLSYKPPHLGWLLHDTAPEEALGVRAKELTLGHWREHQEIDQSSPIVTSEYCHIVRRAAEFLDVFLNPVQGRDLVHEAEVAARSAFQRREKAWRRDGIIKFDQDMRGQLNSRWPFWLMFNKFYHPEKCYSEIPLQSET